MPAVHHHIALILLGGLWWGSLGQARADDQCRLLRVADLPVTMDGNQPLLNGDLNGQPVHWLMDTGSQVSLISSPAADRAGLHCHVLPNYTLRGVGGSTETYLARVDALTLGDWTVHNLDMLVASDHDLGRGDVVGVIGEPVFQQYDMELDFAHAKVTFFKAEGCDSDTSLAYWEGGGASVHIRRGDHRILVPVVINGQEVDALLDTGASLSVISMDLADDLGLRPGEAGVRAAGQSSGIGDKSVKAYTAQIDSFSIGSETIKNTRIRILDQGRIGRGVRMLLGMDFLRAHRVLVAQSQHQLYFSYIGGPVFQVVGSPRRFTSPDPAQTSPPSAAPSAP